MLPMSLSASHKAHQRRGRAAERGGAGIAANAKLRCRKQRQSSISPTQHLRPLVSPASPPHLYPIEPAGLWRGSRPHPPFYIYLLKPLPLARPLTSTGLNQLGASPSRICCPLTP